MYSGSSASESSSASEEDEPQQSEEDEPQQPVPAYDCGRCQSRRGQQGARAFNEAGVLQEAPPPAAAPPVPAAVPPIPVPVREFNRDNLRRNNHILWNNEGAVFPAKVT